MTSISVSHSFFLKRNFLTPVMNRNFELKYYIPLLLCRASHPPPGERLDSVRHQSHPAGTHLQWSGSYQTPCWSAHSEDTSEPSDHVRYTNMEWPISLVLPAWLEECISAIKLNTGSLLPNMTSRNCRPSNVYDSGASDLPLWVQEIWKQMRNEVLCPPGTCP